MRRIWPTWSSSLFLSLFAHHRVIIGRRTSWRSRSACRPSSPCTGDQVGAVARRRSRGVARDERAVVEAVCRARRGRSAPGWFVAASSPAEARRTGSSTSPDRTGVSSCLVPDAVGGRRRHRVVRGSRRGSRSLPPTAIRASVAPWVPPDGARHRGQDASSDATATIDATRIGRARSVEANGRTRRRRTGVAAAAVRVRARGRPGRRARRDALAVDAGRRERRSWSGLQPVRDGRGTPSVGFGNTVSCVRTARVRHRWGIARSSGSAGDRRSRSSPEPTRHLLPG